MADNPCSIPPWLRRWIPEETPAQQRACRRHDRRYQAGGTEAQRLMADAHFLVELLAAKMDAQLAERYFAAVRQYGPSHWGTGRAWAWPEPVPESP